MAVIQKKAVDLVPGDEFLFGGVQVKVLSVSPPYDWPTGDRQEIQVRYPSGRTRTYTYSGNDKVDFVEYDPSEHVW